LVSTEKSLHVLAYNLKRVLRTLGPEVIRCQDREAGVKQVNQF